MPDLTPWIEAQLKRGHPKEEIKNYLTSLGYPAAALAQVDKMKKSSSLTGKEPNSKKFALLGLVAVGVIGILLLWMTDAFSSSQQPTGKEGSSLQPINSYVSNTTGLPI